MVMLNMLSFAEQGVTYIASAVTGLLVDVMVAKDFVDCQTIQIYVRNNKEPGYNYLCVAHQEHFGECI